MPPLPLRGALGLPVLVALFALALAGQACAATVTATLDPQQISVGDSAQLTVTVSGSQDQPAAPQVDGLDINAVGQSTQYEYSNGSINSTASVTYQVTPRREGTFTIPAIQAGNAASQPITLRVGSGSANGQPMAPVPNLPPPSVTPSGPVVLPPASAPPTDADAIATPGNRYGSIQVTLPKREFYIGELVPIDIQVLIPDDVQASVTDLPQFTSDGFTLSPLGPKPEQSEQIANGRAYTVLTWHSALTGVKVGDYPFDLKMPLTVIVPQQMPQVMDANDIFNNFFRNAMSSMGTKKPVTVQSTPVTLKILPLPQENRPADFAGAVGQFEIEASATPTSVNVGDPITLRLKITGSGNFDRVFSDLLANDAHWKTYSPKGHFDPSDSVGYAGTKTFEQPVIPNDPGITSVPSVSFSYFNPETRQYVTRTTAPLAVTVGGTAITPPSASMAATSPAASDQAAPTPAPSSDLRINKIEAGSFVSTLRPVYLNPWFVVGQGMPLLALLGGLAFVRFQKQVAHPERLRAAAVQAAIRQQIAAMDEGMRNHQSDVFFIHARAALQQRLGHRWNIRPESITLADVVARTGDGLETIRPVFEMADQAKYSDLHFEDSDLRQWREAIVNQLAETKG